jgi:coproporphyrinogen III oxidase
MLNREEIAAQFKALQHRICEALERADGKSKFLVDEWTRPGGGGGTSRAMTDGSVIEKGGVNFSAVWGTTPEAVLRTMQIPGDERPDFFATGVSIVLHPFSPMVPIIHMNVRYFEMSNGIWWFGGGIDLTPHYVDEQDATYFHRELKNVCDRHDLTFYPKFKQWADDYFFIKHRNETRGIGGIFFDNLRQGEEQTKERRFAFVMDVGNAFVPLYTHFMDRNKAIPFSESHKQWQYLRRGRYVEFNLVWDRGTKFGLDTDGRTESILMSMPPQANWAYNHQPEPGSAEQKTLSLLRKGVDWVGN